MGIKVVLMRVNVTILLLVNVQKWVDLISLQLEVLKIHLQPLDHSDDLHQSKLLLAGVIIPRGPFILFCGSWTVFVAEFICGMDQLPRILKKTKKLSVTNKPSLQSIFQLTAAPTHGHSQPAPELHSQLP